jgi:hypothetical protein
MMMRGDTSATLGLDEASETLMVVGALAGLPPASVSWTRTLPVEPTCGRRVDGDAKTPSFTAEPLGETVVTLTDAVVIPLDVAVTFVIPGVGVV